MGISSASMTVTVKQQPNKVIMVCEENADWVGFPHCTTLYATLLPGANTALSCYREYRQSSKQTSVWGWCIPTPTQTRLLPKSRVKSRYHRDDSNVGIIVLLEQSAISVNDTAVENHNTRTKARDTVWPSQSRWPHARTHTQTDTHTKEMLQMTQNHTIENDM